MAYTVASKSLRTLIALIARVQSDLILNYSISPRGRAQCRHENRNQIFIGKQCTLLKTKHVIAERSDTVLLNYVNYTITGIASERCGIATSNSP